MSELNFELLQDNIRALIKKHDVTQSELAEIAGMTQPNISKALNSNASKQFTIDQLYRIAQHFGVSIDSLVGNTAADESATSPRAMLALLSKLLCEAKIRVADIAVEEYVYEPYYNHQGFPDCRTDKKQVDYKAFYFPSYHRVDDFAFEEHEQEDVHYEFLSGGNESKYLRLNDILIKLIPMIKLYRETEIPEEAYQMVLKGYLDQLGSK